MRTVLGLVAVVVGGLAGCGDDGGPKDAPDTVIDSSPKALTNQTKVSFTFHATSNANGFVCSVDGQTPSACQSGMEVTVGEGMHTFEVSASLNTLVDDTPAMATWKVDATPPDTQLVMGPPALDNTVTPAIEFAGSDPGGGAVTFECKLDAATYAPCTAPSMFGVTDGAHTFTVRAVDLAGNVDPSPASHQWTVDSSTPDTAITLGPTGGSTTLPDVNFTFSSPASGVTFECSLDGGAFMACNSPQSFTDLPDGMHTFTVRAKSAAGTMDPTPATRTWTVDGTAPSVAITSQPAAVSNDSTPTFGFNSGDATARFECAIDNGAFAACTPAFTSAALADGMHTFRVRAKDPVGNVSTVATYTWTIDTMAPTVTITGGPTGMVASASASFTFTTAGSPSTVECALDTAAFAACTSPKAYTALADGPHTFTVRVADTAGNMGMDMRMFTVDTTPPTVMITSAPTNPTGDNTPTFVFTTAGAPTAVACAVDGGAFAACTSPFTTGVLADGSHTFVVRATDAVGNLASDTRTFTVDTAAPTVTIVNKPANPSAVATANFTFTVSEGSPTCSIDGGAFAACTSPRNYTGLAEGSHTFTVRSADALGNTGMASYTWTIDTMAPTVVINTKPAATTNQTTANFTFTVSDGTIQCQLDGGAFAACTSPRSYTGLVTGNHTFVVRSTDAAGNVGSDTWSWAIDNTAPVVTITAKPANPTKLTTASFAFTVSDGAVECQLDTGAFTVCSSPRMYTGLTAGSHTFTVRATDTAGNVGSDTWSWVIDLTPPTVTINTKPASLTKLTTANFTFTVSDGTIECQLDGGAFAACASPKAYSGLAAGMHTFVVRSTDTATNVGMDSWTWVIDLTPPTVSITGPASPTANRNATLSFTVSEGSPQCKLDTGSFAPCTSPVNYTMLADGSHTFSVQTTDAAGNPGSGSHTWSIDGTGPVVTFSSVPPARWPVNYYDFAWSANESATYECSVNAGTTWFACGTPFGVPTLPNAPAATYGVNNTFSVRGKDALGNTGAMVTHNWTPLAGLVLHYPFEQGLRQNTSLLAQRPAYSPGVAGQGAAVGGWAGTAIRNAAAATYTGTPRPLKSSAQGVYMGGMWVRETNDLANGVLWTNVDSSGLWGHTVSIVGIEVKLVTLQNGVPFEARANIPFGVWAHVGVRTTGPAKGLELLINGQTMAFTQPPSATGFDAGQGDLRIGQVSFLDIDDVRFYNTLVDPCTTLVRGQVPPTGGACVANRPAIELDFEGGRLDETGTMSIGRTAPIWSAFTGKLGDGFRLGGTAVPIVPLQLTNFAQQGTIPGHTISLWVPGSSPADTLFDFVIACPNVTYVGQCGIRIAWTANQTFAVFAGVPGLGSTMQQSIGVPAAPLAVGRTHNLVVAEQRTANGTASLRLYVDGTLAGTLTFGNGDLFAFRSDTIRSCSVVGCSLDELELWPQDLSANSEMLCENGFDGQWDPATDRCNFTSND